LHLVGSFYEFYITMHGSMNIKLRRSSFLKQLKHILLTPQKCNRNWENWRK